MRRRLAAMLAPLLVAALVGCVGSGTNCEALPTTIELTLTAESLTPANPAVCRDREVTLVVTSEVDGVFHNHGYDEQVPATTVTAGERIELRFEATRSGQFPIELHLPGESEGVDVDILTVHEP